MENHFWKSHEEWNIMGWIWDLGSQDLETQDLGSQDLGSRDLGSQDLKIGI